MTGAPALALLRGRREGLSFRASSTAPQAASRLSGCTGAPGLWRRMSEATLRANLGWPSNTPPARTNETVSFLRAIRDALLGAFGGTKKDGDK